ncbi:outer membrane beta-barrel protein [uncultured Cetobacterium sp.]|uniref:outer membrane protein n=1 Tax=uncultured Cetobacterium sp. TaxID=527638 RepID=UPI0025E898E9|nr:outer membrane beta-barrel protein [uncultured Cetobacterium sp.]
MKKILILGGLTIIGAMASAKEVVAPVEVSKEVIMEPVIQQEVIVPVAYKPLYNIYGKVGLDIWSEYDEWTFEGEKLNKKDTDKLGFEIALEGTKNITNNFELGLGIAYQNHATPKSVKESEVETVPEPVRLSRATEYYSEYETEMPSFDSVPLYVVAKYNFETESMWKPYLKATLGYSFNFNSDDLKASYSDYENGVLVDSGSTKFKTDVDNGLYYGIGAGVEYENFFVDLMYQVNQAKAKVSYEDQEFPEDNFSKKNDFNYSRVTLGFGYKFNY